MPNLAASETLVLGIYVNKDNMAKQTFGETDTLKIHLINVHFATSSSSGISGIMIWGKFISIERICSCSHYVEYVQTIMCIRSA